MSVDDCLRGRRHDPGPPHTTSNGHGPRIVATYPYHDEHGKLLYQVMRRGPNEGAVAVK
jgi:hypothetical protein